MIAFEIKFEAIQPTEDGETRRMLTMLDKLRNHLQLPGKREDNLAYTWLQQQMEYPRGSYVLCHTSTDHIAPWFLAENGARVLLVERGENRWLPLIFRTRYAVGGFYRTELESTFTTIRHEIGLAESATLKLLTLIDNSAKFIGSIFPPIGKGSVLLLREHPRKLEQIPEGAVDTVMAPDTLGKYSLDQLRKVIPELIRVLKTGSEFLFNLRLTNGNTLFQDGDRNWVYPLEKVVPILQLTDDQREGVAEAIKKSKTFEMPQGGGSPIVEIGFKIIKPEEEEDEE